MHSDINKTLEENIILNDLFLNAQNKNSKNKDCKPETINLALQIKLVSSKAYEILANNLPFPSSSYIDERFRDSISDIPQKITDLKGINDIINMWKEKLHKSKSLLINACLSVDALYFKPEFKIKIDDWVSSFSTSNEKDICLPKKFFNNFSKSPSSFQTFLDLNWSKIIKASFVFQIQPYDLRYKPFVVFIRPSPNGKVSAEIVDLLYKIRKIANNMRILIKSFVFDGDRLLHYNYFKSYFNRLILVNRF